MSAAQVTEAHLALVRDMAAQGQYLSRSIQHYAQEIAASEAKATAELLQQVANLKYANHYHRKTAETSRATETDRNNLRAERAEAELATARRRLASIFLSGALDGKTAGEIQRWAKDYETELATERARITAAVALLLLLDRNETGSLASRKQSWRAAIDSAMKEGA